MVPTNHSHPAPGRSGSRDGSVAGSIATVVLFAAALVAVSYPLLALAVAAGAIGAHLARRGVRVLRRRRLDVLRTQTSAAGNDVRTAAPPK